MVLFAADLRWLLFGGCRRTEGCAGVCRGIVHWIKHRNATFHRGRFGTGGGGTFSFKIEWLELLVGDSAGFDMGTEYAHLL